MLALHHRNGHAPDLALGSDLHGLLVAGGPEGQIGGKSVGLDKYVDLTAAGSALQIAEDVSACFAPATMNAVALARHVAGQIEFVAVASATQVLLQSEARAINLIVSLAPDPLGSPIRKSDGAVSGPCAAKPGKRARLGMTRRYGQHERGPDTGSPDAVCKQAGAKQFHRVFPFISTFLRNTPRAASKV
jgi:hypothetical protein